MRSKILTAVIAIAAILSVASCHWFSSIHNTNHEFAIHGKWKLDSLDAGDDTTGALIFALAAKDTSQAFVEFNADSTYREIGQADSLLHKYYVKENDLYIQADSAFVPYHLTVVSDSLVHLINKDSLFIALKRQ